MPRPRSPKRDEAYQIYAQHNGNIENRRIAEQLGVDERFISKWKHEDEWVKKNNGVHHSEKGVHLSSEKCTLNAPGEIPSMKTAKKSGRGKSPDSESMETNTVGKYAGLIGNRNAAGNKGGAGGPGGNKFAVRTHEHVKVFYTADIIDDDERAVIDAEFDKYVHYGIFKRTLQAPADYTGLH